MKQTCLLGLASCALVLTACGGGGGGGAAAIASSGIFGTVPGTQIEAFGDNGSYHVVSSTNDGSSAHPFELELPAGMGFRIVMTTNEGTAEEVVTPIGFRDSTGKVRTRLRLGNGDRIDLGHVPLHMSRNEAAGDDRDDDGVLDNPMVLDDVGAGNPLVQSDADEDSIDDYNDPDHGNYHYDRDTADPQDHDDDGVPNVYDNDYEAGDNDSDGDGLPDSVDANIHNDHHHGNDDLDHDCDGDGYHDEDGDHDGFHDDDGDRDGYRDGDEDHDGHQDDDDGHGDDDVCTGGPTPDPTPTPDPNPTPDPTPTPDPNPTPDPTPTPLDGQALYDANCLGCHSNPARFTGISATGISAAIAGISSMNSLSSLTTGEIQAIVDYLAAP